MARPKRKTDATTLKMTPEIKGHSLTMEEPGSAPSLLRYTYLRSQPPKSLSNLGQWSFYIGSTFRRSKCSTSW